MTLSVLPPAADIALLLDLPVETVQKMSLLTKLKALRRAGGLCSCGESAVEGKLKCRACLDRNAEYVRARREKRLSTGTCFRCIWPVEEGKTLCNFHLAVHKGRAKDYRDNKKAK